MIAGVHDQRIGNEEQVEFAALGDLRAGGDQRPARIAAPGALVAPAGGMIAGAEPEHAEVHLAFDRGDRGHVWLAPRDMLRRCEGIGLASVARMERQRNPGWAARLFPDFVSRHPGYYPSGAPKMRKIAGPAIRNASSAARHRGALTAASSDSPASGTMAASGR